MNLAVILTVSGLVLFLVFSASIKRAAIDAKIQDSNAIADLVENQVLRAESSDKLWENVRSVCGARSGLRAGSVRGRWKGPGRVWSQLGLGGASAIRHDS